jgi:uncharacterized protein YjbI with pentapeptide repeats
MKQIPESEKIRLVEELLGSPRSPIRPEAVRSLTREQKLDLFDKLVQGGTITLKEEHWDKTQLSSNDVLQLIEKVGGSDRLKLHGKLLSGSGCERINLRGADLCGTCLNSANLAGADLSNTKLSGVSLRYANLQGANLSGADLSSGKYALPDGKEIEVGAANLEQADLRWANLERACLLGVNFRCARLEQANLTEAEIGRKLGTGKWQIADFECASVTWQQLRSARLRAGILFPHGAGVDFEHNFFDCAVRYRKHGEYERVLELTELFLERSPKDNQTAIAYWHKGYALERLNRPADAAKAYDEALRWFDESISFNPNDAWTRVRKGDFLVSVLSNRFVDATNIYTKALEEYNHALSLEPKNANTYVSKSHALLLLHRNKEALEASEHAIRLNPNYAMAYNNKGAALKRLERTQEARDAFEEAIRLDTGLTLARDNLRSLMK